MRGGELKTLIDADQIFSRNMMKLMDLCESEHQILWPFLGFFGSDHQCFVNINARVV